MRYSWPRCYFLVWSSELLPKTFGKFALRQLLENSHPQSEYALMVFDDESIPLVDFVADQQKIETTLAKISSHRAGSSLYDSVGMALDHFDRARHPRHVLVVITDGADQHSRLRLDDVTSRGSGFPFPGLPGWVFRSKGRCRLQRQWQDGHSGEWTGNR